MIYPDNVVDLAAVRALGEAMRRPVPEALDADRIILEATDALVNLTAENRRLREQILTQSVAVSASSMWLWGLFIGLFLGWFFT